MSWKRTIRELFKQELYRECLDVLHEQSADSWGENFTLDVNLIYMYEYILVESEYSDEEFRQYMSKVQALFREGMRKYGDCAAYLFYTSYIATSYFEYYMGLTEYDAEKMAYQALQREPENLLYQWFRYNFVSHNKGAACERKRILCAKKILQDENLVLELRNMLLVGDDLLNCLRIDVGEIETF